MNNVAAEYHYYIPSSNLERGEIIAFQKDARGAANIGRTQEMQIKDVLQDSVDRQEAACIATRGACEMESKGAAAKGKKRQYQLIPGRWRLFHFCGLQNLDVGELLVHGQYRCKWCWSAERIASGTEQSPQLLNLCQKGRYSLILLSDLPSLLQQLLTSSAMCGRPFWQNIGKYISPKRVNRGLGSP